MSGFYENLDNIVVRETEWMFRLLKPQNKKV